MKLFSVFLALLLCGFPGGVSAGDYEPTSFVIEDQAAVIPVLPGIRRVRVSCQDEHGAWRLFSLAHLVGDEGRIRLRLPEGKTLDEIRIEVSDRDPFPYEVYAGETEFSIESDGALGGMTPETIGNRFDATTADGPEAGATPTVQESDLWQWQGDTLFFYNQLRGLQVFDFSDPGDPTSLGSLRMPALGEDMYLHPDGKHLVLLTKRASWEGSAGSEAVLVRYLEGELSIVSRLPLPGSRVVESRMVGSHLYVAMNNSRWTEAIDEEGNLLQEWETGLTVEHLDLSDPQAPREADSLDLLTTDGWWSTAVVSATPDYFIVAPSSYDSDRREHHSTIHLIDIRDQQAPLEIAASTELPGRLNDKFKLQVRDDVLTCVTQAGRRGDTLKTVVGNYDLGRPTSSGRLPLLDELTLAPRETLFATRFDGDRLYVVTAIQIDPLFVVDLTDPHDLQLLGELKIPGWSHYLQPRGDRLLSVGVEERRVAISQFDVSDPANMSLPSRIYLGQEGTFSWSEGNYDEQAVAYFPEKGLMMVPYQSYGNGEAEPETALQIIRFTDDSLEKAGVIRTDFVSRRSTLLGEGTLVSVAGREVRALDVSDPADPQPLSTLEVAWPVDRVLTYGDYLLQLDDGEYWYWQGSGNTEAVLRISPINDPDEVLARVALPGNEVRGLDLQGDTLHLLTSKSETYQSDEGLTDWRRLTFHTRIDLRDPLAPGLAKPEPLELELLHQQYHLRTLQEGRVAWIPEVAGGHSGWGYFPTAIDFWPGRPGFPGWYHQATEAQVIILDLNDPVAVKVRHDHRLALDAVGPDPDERREATLTGIVEEGDALFLSFRSQRWTTDEEGESSRLETEHRMRVARLDQEGRISVEPGVSIPGTLAGVRSVGEGSSWLLLSSAVATRPREDGSLSWSNDLVLQTSAFDGFSAFLIDEVTVSGSYGQDLEITGDFFALPHVNWSGSSTEQTLEFYPFELTGQIDDPISLSLEFHAYDLVFQDGILATKGWTESGQLWWMLNPETLEEPEPAVLEIRNRLSANLNEMIFDWERELAWVPVGHYGVETIEVASLRKSGDAGEGLKAVRLTDAASPWVTFLLHPEHLVAEDDRVRPGPLADHESWHFETIPSITYRDWITGKLGGANDPDFVLPEKGGDLDRDGLSNWAEYLFGTDPARADSPALRATPSDGEGRAGVEFSLPTGRMEGDWQVQISRDLDRWSRPALEEMSMRAAEAGQTRMILHFATGTAPGSVFFRLKAVPN